MTILSQVYASAPAAEVLIPTLDISHPAISAIRVCAGFEDQTVTLETGQEATFVASGLDVSLPARNASGQQNLTFAIENVTGEAQRLVDDALDGGHTIRAVYREYLASDLSAPAAEPLRMVVVGAKMQGSTLQVTASYQDIIGRAWPRDRYNATDHPGLRYL